MSTPATGRKRAELLQLIERVLAPEPAVQGVVAVGSVASGLARADSDIDAVVFLQPFDAYIVPAEFIWQPSDGSFHSIFSEEPALETGIQFDLTRVDLARWAEPSFEWPEARRAELSEGWIAFDRTGLVAALIAARTVYNDADRLARLDEAVTWLDQLLAGDAPQRCWDTLGPATALDRLQSAYECLAQALFAYNRRWRPWRKREMPGLLALPWLPERFAVRLLPALSAPSLDFTGYRARVDALLGLFFDLAARLRASGLYGEDVIGEAFIRSHDEPGRAWNMEEWNRRHAMR